MIDRQRYLDGGEGMTNWCEDNVRIKIIPLGKLKPVYCPMNELPKDEDHLGRSYYKFWQHQKKVLHEALEMKNKEFLHTLIVFCWMRGEGKSVDAVLIQLWKLMCFANQTILLAANSKDQTSFAHFKVMEDLVRNSPKILSKVGTKNILRNQIRLKNARGGIVSYVETISSFTGVWSNITGYTFSEMFQMKKPDFFTQIDGSTRVTPNALGTIDSTVSHKQHQLYKLWDNYVKKKDPKLYFSYRNSPEAVEEDFWNPRMDAAELDSRRERYMPGEFEQYFKNTWESGSETFFTPEMIDETNYLGVDRAINKHDTLIELITKRNEAINQEKKLTEKSGMESSMLQYSQIIDNVESRLWPVENVYTLTDEFGMPNMATANDLTKLGDIFDTGWAILAGIDRADPMKTNRTAARTVVTGLAKGLIGSISDYNVRLRQEVVPYLYVLVCIMVVDDNSISGVKEVLLSIQKGFDGIDSVGGERWGLVDEYQWMIDQGMNPTIFQASYPLQRTMFSMLFLSYKRGLFKTPAIPIIGSKEDDILREEASVFQHNPQASTAAGQTKFGSPEKDKKDGIQDDVMMSLGCGMYGGKDLGIECFRERKGNINMFGQMFQNKGLLGRW